MLKAQVNADEFAALPEVIQAAYVEHGDVFQLGVEPVNGLQLADVAKLQGALSKERTSAREAKSILEKFKDLDAEQAREALEFKKRFDDGELDDEAKERLVAREKQLSDKFEGQRKQLSDRYEAQLTEAKNREQQLFSQLKDSKVTSSVRAAIASHGGNMRLLEPVVLRRVELREENGKFAVFVMNEDGEPMLSRKPGSTTEPMSPDEYVAMLRDDKDFAAAFNSTGSSGTGSGGRTGSPGTIRLSQEDAKNPQKYREAQAKARELGVPFKIEG